MTTEPMPETVAAVAALSSLRHAYPRLAVVAEAEAWGGRTTPRPRTPMSQAAKTRTDERVRTERAYSRYMEIRGIQQIITGTGTTPVRVDVLDAEQLARTTVVEAAWLAASAARTAHAWLSPRANLTDTRRIWLTATTYLETAIWDVPTATAAGIARELEGADRAVRAAAGLAEVRVPVPGHPPCPACGRLGLRIDATPADPDAWTVACRPDCLCLGSQCSCDRYGRSLGQRHLWTVGQMVPVIRRRMRETRLGDLFLAAFAAAQRAAV